MGAKLPLRDPWASCPLWSLQQPGVECPAIDLGPGPSTPPLPAFWNKPHCSCLQPPNLETLPLKSILQTAQQCLSEMEIWSLPHPALMGKAPSDRVFPYSLPHPGGSLEHKAELDHEAKNKAQGLDPVEGR